MITENKTAMEQLMEMADRESKCNPYLNGESYSSKDYDFEIPILIHDGGIMPIDIEEGDWIDLATPYDLKLKRFVPNKIDFKIAMRLPKGYEAHIAPRSSTFDRYGIILTNGIGIIDNSYCGDTDTWKALVLPFKDCEISRGTRLFQFRIIKKQGSIKFKQVNHLSNKSRGGYGSTGI